MASMPFILGIISLGLAVSKTTACPESCFCMDTFVSCSDFRFLDLTLLPRETDTLVLTKGDVEEIPPGFLATATNLKMLEIMSVNVRIVRGSAFRGLRNIDLLSITSCSFDIVEPDGFSGLTNAGKIHISDSTFGRIGKHAFAYINNVVQFKIWSSSFDTISDEAFYKLSDVTSFQFYYNNVTSMGSDTFLGAFRLGDIDISMNRIHTVSKGSFENIAKAAANMMLNGNTFACSCDLAWWLDIPILKVYLPYNFCSFTGSLKPEEFVVSEISRDRLCSMETSTQAHGYPTGDKEMGLPRHPNDFSVMEEVFEYDVAETETELADTSVRWSNTELSTPVPVSASAMTSSSPPSPSSSSSPPPPPSSSSPPPPSPPPQSSSSSSSSSTAAASISSSSVASTSSPSWSSSSSYISSSSPASISSSSSSSPPSSSFSQSSSSSTPLSTSSSSSSSSSSVVAHISSSSSSSSSSSTPSSSSLPSSSSSLSSSPLPSSSSVVAYVSSSSTTSSSPPLPSSSSSVAGHVSSLSFSPLPSSPSSSSPSSTSSLSLLSLLMATSSQPVQPSSTMSLSQSPPVSLFSLTTLLNASSVATLLLTTQNSSNSSTSLSTQPLLSAAPNTEKLSPLSSPSEDSSFSSSFKEVSSSTPMNNKVPLSTSSNSKRLSSETTEVTKPTGEGKPSSFQSTETLFKNNLPLKSNPQPAGEESTIAASENIHNFAVLSTETEWPHIKESIDTIQNDAVDNHESAATVSKHKITRKTHNDINEHFIDKLNLIDKDAPASTAEATASRAVTKWPEHAIAYTEAAFEMANLFSENAAQFSSPNSFFIILFFGVCIFFSTQS